MLLHGGGYRRPTTPSTPEAAARSGSHEFIYLLYHHVCHQEHEVDFLNSNQIIHLQLWPHVAVSLSCVSMTLNY